MDMYLHTWVKKIILKILYLYEFVQGESNLCKFFFPPEEFI